MAEKMIKGTGLEKVLDAYGIRSATLGNDFMNEIANGIRYNNLVEVKYVAAPLLEQGTISDRVENFIVMALDNAVAAGSNFPLSRSGKIWSMDVNRQNVDRLVRGREGITFGESKLNYQQAMDRLTKGLQKEAAQMQENYRGVSVEFESIKRVAPERRLFHYKKLVSRDPHHALARLYSAVGHVNREELNEAEKQATKALMLRPNDPRILNQVGVICDRKGDLRSARLYYEHAVKTEPTYTKALYNLAIISKKEGKLSQAKHMMRQAAARGNSGARRKLNELK
jgi:tetratricopeptide (TPR) repeat protein